MAGLAAPSEDCERLMLGRGRKGEEAQVRLSAALGHTAKEFLQVLAPFLRRIFPRLVAQPLATEHLLEVRCRLTTLRAVRLVNNHGAAPRRQRSRAFLAALLG